jgi:ABC-2 type transport system ATP-binding protein
VVEVPRPYPHLTAAETLSYLGELRGLKGTALRDRVDELLARLGLASVSGKRGSQLSRGMQQRLALAAALLASPPVLLLDEPTAGLDPAGMVEVRNLVREEAARGVTVFLSSHLLREIQEVADVVGFLHRGRLLRVASAEEVRGPEPWTLEFAEEPPWEALEAASRLPGVVSIERKGGLEFSLSLLGSAQERAALVETLVRRGARLSYLGRPSGGSGLEELYLSLLGEEGEGPPPAGEGRGE